MMKLTAPAILVLSLLARLGQESAAEKPPVPAILALSREGSGQDSISRALITVYGRSHLDISIFQLT